jgi:hypothetical protein
MSRVNSEHVKIFIYCMYSATDLFDAGVYNKLVANLAERYTYRHLLSVYLQAKHCNYLEQLALQHNHYIV